MTCRPALALRICVALAALILPSVGPGHGPWYGSAFAASDEEAEKEAFEAAKALGTVEAWDAFLTHYPNGFRADLARAYVKKLADQPQAAPPPAAAGSANDDSPPRQARGAASCATVLASNIARSAASPKVSPSP